MKPTMIAGEGQQQQGELDWIGQLAFLKSGTLLLEYGERRGYNINK
jgi:hypothetical protein